MPRPPAEKFQDLEIWQLGHQLAIAVYRATAQLPPNEEYGLKSQMRRAAVSVPSNIAEGFKRRTPADKARFLNIAQGSLAELTYLVILCADLALLPSTTFTSLLEKLTPKLDAAESTMWMRAAAERSGNARRRE